MENLSVASLIVLVVGSGGIIGGLVSVATLIFSRLDKKRQNEKDDSMFSAEEKKVNLDRDRTVHDQLWKIIDAKELEIRELKATIDALEAESPLNRPKVREIYDLIRLIQRDVDSVKVILLSTEDTTFFNTKWVDIKERLNSIESLLP